MLIAFLCSLRPMNRWTGVHHNYGLIRDLEFFETAKFGASSECEDKDERDNTYTWYHTDSYGDSNCNRKSKN